MSDFGKNAKSSGSYSESVFDQDEYWYIRKHQGTYHLYCAHQDYQSDLTRHYLLIPVPKNWIGVVCL